MVPPGAGDGVGAGVAVGGTVGVTGGVVGTGVGVVPGGGKPQVCGSGLQPVLPEPIVTIHDCGPSQLSMPPTVRPLAVTLLADPVTVFTLLENANMAPLMLMPFMAMVLVGLPPSNEIAAKLLLSISSPETVKGELMEPLSAQNMSAPNWLMPWSPQPSVPLIVLFETVVVPLKGAVGLPKSS